MGASGIGDPGQGGSGGGDPYPTFPVGEPYGWAGEDVEYGDPGYGTPPDAEPGYDYLSCGHAGCREGCLDRAEPVGAGRRLSRVLFGWAESVLAKAPGTSRPSRPGPRPPAPVNPGGSRVDRWRPGASASASGSASGSALGSGPALASGSALGSGSGRDGRGARSDAVYLARRTTNGAEVAVRIHGSPLRTDRQRLRFDQEVHGLRRLSAVPHLAAVYEGGTLPDGRPYLVTQFCGGGCLAEHVNTVGRLTSQEVGRIGAKLAGALVAAHRRNIFHRNVSPATVLINAAGEPVLANFVLLSVVLADPGTPTTPAPRAFVAPEAYLPELRSAAADIYSLGATLYAALAGTPTSMVDGDSLLDLPRVPASMMAVLRRALAHDPRDRFAAAEELHAALVAATPASPAVEHHEPGDGGTGPRRPPRRPVPPPPDRSEST